MAIQKYFWCFLEMANIYLTCVEQIIYKYVIYNLCNFQKIFKFSKQFIAKSFYRFSQHEICYKKYIERLIILLKIGFFNITILFLFLVNAKKLCYPLHLKKSYLCWGMCITDLLFYTMFYNRSQKNSCFYKRSFKNLNILIMIKRKIIISYYIQLQIRKKLVL